MDSSKNTLTILDYAVESRGGNDYKVHALVHDGVTKTIYLYSSILSDRPIEMNWTRGIKYNVGTDQALDERMGHSFSLIFEAKYQRIFIVDRYNWAVSVTSIGSPSHSLVTKDLPDKANNSDVDERFFNKKAVYISDIGYMYFGTKDKLFYSNDLDTMSFREASLNESLDMLAGVNNFIVATKDNKLYIAQMGTNIWTSHILPPGRSANNHIIDILFEKSAEVIYVVSNNVGSNLSNNLATINLLSYKDGSLSAIKWLPGELYNNLNFEIGDPQWLYLGKYSDNTFVNNQHMFGVVDQIQTNKVAHNYFKLDLATKQMTTVVAETIPGTAEDAASLVNVHYQLVSNLFAICLYVDGKLWLRPLNTDIGWQPVSFDPPKNEIMLNYDLQIQSNQVYAMVTDPNVVTPDVYLAKISVDKLTQTWERLIPVGSLFDELILDSLYKVRTVMRVKNDVVFLLNVQSKRLIVISNNRIPRAYDLSFVKNIKAKTFVVEQATESFTTVYIGADNTLYMYVPSDGPGGSHKVVKSFDDDLLIFQKNNDIKIVGTDNSFGKIYVALNDSSDSSDFIEFHVDGINIDFAVAKLYLIALNNVASPSYFTLTYSDGSVFKFNYEVKGGGVIITPKSSANFAELQLLNYYDEIATSDPFGGNILIEVIQDDYTHFTQDAKYTGIMVKSNNSITKSNNGDFYVFREDDRYSNPKFATSGAKELLYLDYYGNLYLSNDQGATWQRIAITSK